MSGPIGGVCPDTSSSIPSTDDYLRAATGARPEASASHHGHGHDAVEHGVHLGAELAEGGLDLAASGAEGTAAGFGFELGAMGLSIAAAFTTWVSGPIEGARRGLEYDSEMMRGCLAAFEGRAGDPDVVVAARENEAFANGIREADLLAFRDPELFACVRAAVVAANAGGASAVYAGTDSGPSFDARYEGDLAFRHGVDRARELRAADPAAFEAAAREAGALSSAVEGARTALSVRA